MNTNQLRPQSRSADISSNLSNTREQATAILAKSISATVCQGTGNKKINPKLAEALKRAELIESISAKKNFGCNYTIREAKPSDAQIIYSWVSEDEIPYIGARTEEFTENILMRWIATSDAKHIEKGFIFELQPEEPNKNRAAAFINFKINLAKAIEIEVGRLIVDPLLRNKGIGRQASYCLFSAISEAIQQEGQHFERKEEIIILARYVEDNIPGQKMVQKLPIAKGVAHKNFHTGMTERWVTWEPFKSTKLAEEVGKRLYEFEESQESAAWACDIDRTTLNQILSKKKNPSLPVAIRLINHFGSRSSSERLRLLFSLLGETPPNSLLSQDQENLKPEEVSQWIITDTVGELIDAGNDAFLKSTVRALQMGMNRWYFLSNLEDCDRIAKRLKKNTNKETVEGQVRVYRAPLLFCILRIVITWEFSMDRLDGTSVPSQVALYGARGDSIVISKERWQPLTLELRRVISAIESEDDIEGFQKIFPNKKEV